MNIAFVCVLIAGLMPLACAVIAKWGFQDFDNHYPRDWMARQTGFRARANAAQSNSLEAFAFFAVAVVLATLSHADSMRVDVCASVFVLSRVCFIACYVADLASLRSWSWLIGWLSVLGIYSAALGY